MKKITNIFKTGVAVAFAAAIGFGCNYDRPASNPTDDTSTSEAIVAMDSSAANLNNPRPAPIGDTSETASQANRFGEMNPNQDTAARRLQKLDELKKKRKQ
ncbi:hypothetical protein ABID22_003536 [Pontibacter aydingkolensis]|uniref:Lipoprotein n=1 Tax=Pontibacter aydingkolensis TaxID=1911536 RepID=A0ABS7CY94_9BACT|nr:hypothetical protein [Pontibacter aydingkolensis]MBW7468846.1 hypothetical protein [Pontibacter aydingkolensis]